MLQTQLTHKHAAHSRQIHHTFKTAHCSCLCALLMMSPLGLANEPEPSTLPLGVILDSQGQPIALPTDIESGLEYRSQEHLVHEPSTKASLKAPQKPSPKKTKKSSRKQQLASRNSVANDPSCRWLDQRMDQLEAKLKLKSGDYGYHQTELSKRQDEWYCLKCGAEGPGREERDNCPR